MEVEIQTIKSYDGFMEVEIQTSESDDGFMAVEIQISESDNGITDLLSEKTRIKKPSKSMTLKVLYFNVKYKVETN